MPTRSIKLKLIIPQGDDEVSRRKRLALWDTHKFVNEAVAVYQAVLLEMRQGDVCVGDDADGRPVIRRAVEYRNDLIARLRRRGASEETVQAALPHLRALYEAIVPSAVEGEKGTAQAARALHSPLVDPDSNAGEATGRKLEEFASGVAVLDTPEFGAVACRLLAQNPNLARPAGAPPKWANLWRSRPGDNAWIEALREDLRKAVAGASSPLQGALAFCRAKKVLPLLEPYSRGRLEEGRVDSALNPVERMAFSLAVDHLLPWERWGHRARKQFAERENKVKVWDQKFASSHAAVMSAIRRFETERSANLAEVAFWSEDSQYRLRPRELGQGWTRLREWLTSRTGRAAGLSERVDKVHALQTELGRDFGSETVLKWLAHPEQQSLADHPEGDPVTRVAVRNVLQGIVDRTRLYPKYTPADAWMHPRFAGFSPPSDSNQPAFSLQSEGGRLYATFNLLVRHGAQWIRENERFELAPSGQAEGANVRLDDKHLILTARSQDGLEDVMFRVGGSNLLFSRRRLEQAAADPSAGYSGSVCLKLSVERQPFDEALSRANGRLSTWLTASAASRVGKTSKNRPIAPLRVLAIDLGLRTAATGAVFEASSEAVTKPWPLHPKGHLHARHLRSFKLALPGEVADATVRARRDERWRAVREILMNIAHLQVLGRLARVSSGERARRLDETDARFRLAAAEVAVDFGTLRNLANDDRFVGVVEAEWRRMEAALAVKFKEWRRSSHTSGEEVFGKSAEGIEYKEAVLKAIRRWHRHQAPWKQAVQRYNRKTQGTVGRRLLDHLNAIKEDRVKTTADLIVQAARGIVYDADSGWVHKHEAAQVIVLEDLSRYRFRNDRSRAENRLLMQWSHREITSAVKMQAEVYGIAVMDSAQAAFSSKFDSLTRTPGVRARSLSADDVRVLEASLSLLRQDEWPVGAAGMLCRTLAKTLCGRAVSAVGAVDALAMLRVGDVVPYPGGELFVAVDPEAPSKARVRHADINAAQNIGARLLEAYTEPFRLSARNSLDRPLAVTRKLGERATAAFGEPFVVLERVPGSEVVWNANACSARDLTNRYRLPVPDGAADDEVATGMDDGGSGAAEALPAVDDLDGQWSSYFRDPSFHFFQGHWVDAKVFWHRVHQDTLRVLQQSGRCSGHPPAGR